MTLRQKRQEAGLTLRQLGGILGINHVFVSEIELGKRPLPVRLAERWGTAIGLSGPARGRPPETIDVRDLTPAERERVALFVAGLRAGRAA